MKVRIEEVRMDCQKREEGRGEREEGRGKRREEGRGEGRGKRKEERESGTEL